MARGRTEAIWVRWTCRVGIAVFLLAIGAWGWRAGVDIRERAWSSTKTIRFNGDISNAVFWGNDVLRTGERLAARANANATPPRPATPGQPPGRPALSLMEILRGEGQVYSSLMHDRISGEFELDYPPLRLLTMALWMRDVQVRFPNMVEWPNGRGPSGRPQQPRGIMGIFGGSQRSSRHGPTEEVAEPLLRMNMVAEVLTALFAFALVWLWVHRGSTGSGLTPFRRANGLVLFPITFAAFAYAISVAMLPSPPPPPAVAVTALPVLTSGNNASVTAWIDPQGADTQWHVEWGQQPGQYDHSTDTKQVGPGNPPAEATIDLIDLPANATVHYRIVARNDGNRNDYGRGITRGQDQTLIVTPDAIQPAIDSTASGMVWLTAWQWAGIAIVFIVMCGAMRVLPGEHRAWAAGLVAATFIWFDPSLIINSHVWPQWDAWVLPPFLAAALLASCDCWMLAGVALGLGGMLKGQVLLGSPVLLIWPLLSMRWGAALRLSAGAALAAGIVVSQWLVFNNEPMAWSAPPVKWIAAILIAATLATAMSLYRRPVLAEVKRLWHMGVAKLRQWRNRKKIVQTTETQDSDVITAGPSRLALILFIVASIATLVWTTLLILDPWPKDPGLPRSFGIALLVAILIVPWLIRRRSLGVWAVVLLAVGIWGSGFLFHGDWSWKTVGFDYGTRKFDHLAISHGRGGMNNLGTILATQFGWDTHDPMFTLHLPNVAGWLYAGRSTAPQWLHSASLDGTPITLDVKETMLAIYGLCILIAGAAAAAHARRRDPRILAALVAPWVLMPNLLAQMMNRYEMWGAVLASMLVGISCELGLLHVMFTLIAAGMVAAQLSQFDPMRSPQIVHLMQGMGPSNGGFLLLGAVAVLVMAVLPGREPKKRRKSWRKVGGPVEIAVESQVQPQVEPVVETAPATETSVTPSENAERPVVPEAGMPDAMGSV